MILEPFSLTCEQIKRSKAPGFRLNTSRGVCRAVCLDLRAMKILESKDLNLPQRKLAVAAHSLTLQEQARES